MVVGRIIGAYGVRGWLKASPFNAAQESVLLSGRHWWLDRPPGVLQIVQSRSQGSSVVAQARDITVREAAEALKAAPDGVARLIPFVAAVIQSVDLPTRRIVADWRLDY